LAVFFPALVQAGPNNFEPRRIYDIQSGNLIDNPDCREPARKKRAVRPERRDREPRRIFDIGSRQFVGNPDAQDPIGFPRAPRSGRQKAVRRW
jgi:hypothetical protein